MSNLDIWNSVGKTDPAYTKAFSRGGGFRGTATNATWLAKRATEMFGPIGIGWGIKVLDERVLDGAEGEKVHRVHICLWYKWDGELGKVEHFGQTTFVGKNKHGWFTDEEAPKKSLTDAMSKALSLLGFASDVHLGLFDDNKYVNDLKREFAEREQTAANDQRQGVADELVKAITAAGTIADLDRVKQSTLFKRDFASLDDDGKARVVRAGVDRRAEIEGGVAA